MSEGLKLYSCALFTGLRTRPRSCRPYQRFGGRVNSTDITQHFRPAFPWLLLQKSSCKIFPQFSTSLVYEPPSFKNEVSYQYRGSAAMMELCPHHIWCSLVHPLRSRSWKSAPPWKKADTLAGGTRRPHRL